MQWGCGNSREFPKPDPDVGSQPGQTAVYPEPGVRYHGSSQNFARAAVATLQDLFFDIDVLDEELGIVSGKKWFNYDSTWADHPTYYLYQNR